MSAVLQPPESEAQHDIAELQRSELEQAWRQFGAAASPEEFCRSWLALQCHIIGKVNAAVVVLQKPATDTFAPLAYWPERSADRAQLAAVTEQALREGRGVIQPRAVAAGAALPVRPDYQLAYPVRLDGRPRGAVGMEIAWREEAQLQVVMRQLQWGAGWLEVLLRRHTDPTEAARLRLKLILQLVATFLERPHFKDAVTALVTETATQLGCDLVVLGLREGSGMKIAAVSHTVQFDPRTNLLRDTEAAMLEALDQGEPIVVPPARDGRLAVTLAHAELARVSGAGGVATVPLLRDGRPIGALTLQRAPGFPFDAPSVELLEGLGSMLGPLLDLQRTQRRSLPRHAADSVREYWGRLAGPRHGGFKFGFLALLLFAGFMAFGTGNYRVSADARIEGETQRALTAPFQGYVRAAAHRAGDVVKQGTVLAQLDDRDLQLERQRLVSLNEQLAKQYREAMAGRDRAKVLVVKAQIDQARAQLALVEEQLGRVALVAPFDGVVVSGDLSQAHGAPLERGQVLFEIAPLDAYRVVLQVDEHDVAYVKPGQRGEMVLSSMPGSRYPFAVKKMTPVNTSRDGRNFFRVEAQFDAAAGAQLRPGMEGVAKVVVDERRLIWIWTRGLIDWARLKIWTWLP
ncbi:MAG: HlyD family efflux transporter periplasmic adaptor subunit [Betaproteobacteria bacterium]|nr:MAG: HlyD family efflux transporter periplasmic adaptor subunit [Betaproteobacteria bacterium]